MMIRRTANFLGKTIGRLTVIAEGDRITAKNGRPLRRWLCRCSCGNGCFRTTAQFSPGYTARFELSCGCSRAEKTLERSQKHGLAPRQGRRPEYAIWKAMRMRCAGRSKKDAHLYIGRGIAVCERWNDFALFFQDMGERPSPDHSIDRIDNDKGYSPDNCRWATPVEQRHNQRRYLESHPEAQPC